MEEIESALRSMEGYTLLLKGAPGSGKTTFAVSLLEQICTGDSKGAYISTRIDPTALYKQFPGLEERIPVKNVIDGTQSEFSEARSQVFYEDLTSFLGGVYSVVAEEDVTILILDSWDAVSFQIGEENRGVEKLETSMLDIARKTKTHLILISEYTGEKRLDYLVDAILRLEKGEIDGRIMRKVFIDKLRGFKVLRNNYPFTLEGGEFTHFVTPASGLGSGRHRVIMRGWIHGNYSTGIEDLDTIIGGYPKGGFVLLELMDDSISQSYRPFLYHTLADFMLNGHGVLYMPEDGSSSVKRLLLDYVSEELLAKNLRMPTASESGREEPCLFHVGAESVSLDKYFEIYKELKKPVLHVLGLTALNLYGEDEIRRMIQGIVSWVRTTEDVLIGVSKPSARLKNEIRELADLHLRFFPINGTLNFYGVKPHTVIYNVSSSRAREGHHQLKLTPIV